VSVGEKHKLWWWWTKSELFISNDLKVAVVAEPSRAESNQNDSTRFSPPHLKHSKVKLTYGERSRRGRKLRSVARRNSQIYLPRPWLTPFRSARSKGGGGFGRWWWERGL